MPVMVIHLSRAASHFHLLAVLPTSYLSSAVAIPWELSIGPRRLLNACFGHLHDLRLHHYNVPKNEASYNEEPSALIVNPVAVQWSNLYFEVDKRT